MNQQDKANGWQTEAEVRADLYIKELGLVGVRAFDRGEGYFEGYTDCQKYVSLPLALLTDALNSGNLEEAKLRLKELSKELIPF